MSENNEFQTAIKDLNEFQTAIKALPEAFKKFIETLKELARKFPPILKSSLGLSNRHNVYGHNLRMLQRRRAKRYFWK